MVDTRRIFQFVEWVFDTLNIIILILSIVKIVETKIKKKIEEERE